jgi:hypothetical protein
MTVIRVPRPPAEAQNKNRRLSDLLKAQIKHFRHAEEHYIDSIKTEGEAANYIKHVTRLLHPEGAQAEAEQRRPKLMLAKPSVVSASKPLAAPIMIDRIAAEAGTQAAAGQAAMPGPRAVKDNKPARSQKKKPGKGRR